MRAECGGGAGQNPGGRVSKNKGLEGHAQGPACRPSVCRQARRSQDDRGGGGSVGGWVVLTHTQHRQGERGRSCPHPKGSPVWVGVSVRGLGQTNQPLRSTSEPSFSDCSGARQPRFQPGSPHFPLRDQLWNSLRHNYRR